MLEFVVSRCYSAYVYQISIHQVWTYLQTYVLMTLNKGVINTYGFFHLIHAEALDPVRVQLYSGGRRRLTVENHGMDLFTGHHQPAHWAADVPERTCLWTLPFLSFCSQLPRDSLCTSSACGRQCPTTGFIGVNCSVINGEMTEIPLLVRMWVSESSARPRPLQKQPQPVVVLAWDRVFSSKRCLPSRYWTRAKCSHVKSGLLFVHISPVAGDCSSRLARFSSATATLNVCILLAPSLISWGLFFTRPSTVC